jgi:hypothetical protein
MKRICTFVLAGTMAIPCIGQTAQSSLTASITGDDRISLVKTSIDVPAWHEKDFWPLYEEYLQTASEVSVSAYRALDDLASTDKTSSEQEAFENGKKLLKLRSEELEILNTFYASIGKDFNGLIALQFLQTETLLDMMESARIYENSQWKKFRFQPRSLAQEQFSTAKRNMITKALALSQEETDAFWSVYADLEEERDATLGTNYDMIAVFAGEVTDFTPALAKRLGYDFLTLMEREQKLKEKYFLKMNEAAGPSLAARFLAWEDYYSLISKMHSWAESE